ncbi:hypothetical protein SAMN07250955_11934 [Arboricoccus pini]|uniref:Amidohydrolase 3 domain-containing protein n=1 Tax=Arboricoccus pini TaxID=1963835 RepID=A0A212S0Y1_9PROT|nr:amidohydrolase [Arboricoccus pini]SNB78739.1 hypothetical protein SAMN07250955_11934 [Arboricoccus pini]
MADRADLVILNGRILTMDEAEPRAAALAIQGNRIVALGSNEEIAAWCGPATKRIDAAGATVLPGFNEGHMHLFQGACELEQLNLLGVMGKEALTEAVRTYAAGKPDLRLIIGQQANYTVLGVDHPVSRQDLDQILPDRPLLLFSPDHHTAWANSLALEQAGILRGRDVGVGNEIVMGADGLATGELRENRAIDPVASLSDTGGRERLGVLTGGDPEPPPTAAERAGDLERMRRGLAYCATLGITSIQNMDGNLYQLELLAELERRGQLTQRVRIPFHMKNFMPLTALQEAVARKERFAGPKLKADFVKVFMDGVLDSWTAVMVDDYADRPGWRGEPLFSADHFNALAIEADRLGLQIAVHAIGDGAVRMVLDGYEAARAANGPNDHRHRIEHIELLHQEDAPRFAELGVVASMQPVHPPGSAGLPLEPTVSRIGRARWGDAYPWKTLQDQGVPMVFATDWPVSPLDPLFCLGEALKRQPWAPGLPDHRPSLHEALRSYTATSAWVSFEESSKGRLRPGYLADIVVLSGDIEATSPDAIADLRPVLTICDGEITHQA